jgi:hypothetical protein
MTVIKPPVVIIIMNSINSFLGILLILVICGPFLYFILRDTLRGSGRWGINLKSVKCPRCGKPTPQIRTPTSLRQAAWGGFTCSQCSCEIDKWGKEIKPGKLNA